MGISRIILVLYGACLGLHIARGDKSAIDRALDYQSDYADEEEVISLKLQLDNYNKRMALEMGTLRNELKEDKRKMALEMSMLRDELATMGKNLDSKIHDEGVKVRALEDDRKRTAIEVKTIRDELAAVREDFDLKLRDGEANLRALQGDNNQLTLEIRTLRAELKTVSQNCDSKVENGLKDLDARMREVTRASHDSVQDMATIKSLAETVALKLKEATGIWNSTVRGIKSTFEEESSVLRNQLSEIQSEFEHKVNSSNISIQLEEKINQNAAHLTQVSSQISELETLKNDLVTTNAQVETFRLKVQSAGRNCDSQILRLNTSVRNDIQSLKIETEANIRKSIQIERSSFDTTINRILESQGQSQEGVTALFSRSLKLVKAATFRSGRGHLAAVYDGKDSIYIIGGYQSGTYLDEVVKYSLTTSETWLTRTLTTKISSGAAAMDGSYILYFGGQLPGSVKQDGVYRFSPFSSSDYTRVGSLGRGTWGMGLAWDPVKRIAYLFGGETPPDGASNQVLSYSLGTNRPTSFSALPQKRWFIAAAWDSKRNVSHLFTGNNVWQSTPSGAMNSYNPLSIILSYPCGVYASANDHVYVFGGGKLIKHNPANHLSTILDVQGWPHNLHATACAYVPKLHRMYIFGGYGRYSSGDSEKWRDEISFVDLDWD